MRVVWDAEAKRQLDEVVAAMIADNPVVALEWLESLDELLQNTAAFPESGRVILDQDDAILREVIHGRYRIAYLLKPKSIEILTVWHGARRTPGRGIAGALDDE